VNSLDLLREKEKLAAKRRGVLKALCIGQSQGVWILLRALIEHWAWSWFADLVREQGIMMIEQET
jgi:hypothetical protein